MNSEKLNRTVFIRDNLEVLRCLEDKTVDLIYLDPPFNSNKNYSAPIGSKAAGFHFKDMWYLSDTDKAWWGELSDKYPDLYEIIHAIGRVNGDKDKSYLIYMAMRLLEIHRILKDTGSIYLHCDQTMSHSLKLLMDAIFKNKNYINEIIWSRALGRGKIIHQKGQRSLKKDTDSIFHYSKTDNHFFQGIYKKLSGKEIEKKFPLIDENGRRYYAGRMFNLPSMGSRPNQCYEYKGISPPHHSGWRFIKKRLIEEDKKEKIVWRKGKSPFRKEYADEYLGKPIGSLWIDIDYASKKERTGYKTQKPLPLLDRIIKASCPESGLVLDPFCGCATACIAAEKLNRKWIGIDLSPLAEKLVKKRFVDELGLFSNLVNIRKDWPIKNAPEPSKNIKHILYGLQKGFCNGCKEHFKFRHFHIDHKIPKAKGGRDTDGNLQLLCGHCNSVKGNRPMSYLLAKLKAV